MDLFTNRLSEQEAFAQALLNHVERVMEGRASLATERDNVLTFFGVGGVGKSHLSCRLQEWVSGDLPDQSEWGPPLALDQPIRTIGKDFHGSGIVNAVDLVIQLRGAYAQAARRFPAFDLGLAAWWSAAYPGVPLPNPRTSTFDVRGQITDTVNDILTDEGAGFGVGPLSIRSAWMLTDAILSRRLRDRALRECEPLAEIVRESQRNASDYVDATLAGLLSWDLQRMDPRSLPLVIVFADTVEYLQRGDRTQERLFNRVVSLTPKVFWVVTSRDRLDWDSPDLQDVLPSFGPAVWPGLRLGNPPSTRRQYLIGDLSDTDVDRFLAKASGADGNPVLSADVMARIREAAGGLPLYLELSLDIARELAADDLKPEAFGQPLPQMVRRIFQDLPEVERDVARAAALLPRFDPELIGGTGSGRVGDALRFCRRSLVRSDGHPYFNYRLHDAVRAAIVSEAVDGAGAWASADRTAQAERLLAALHERLQQVRRDPEHALDIIEIAAGLCADHGLRPTWLLRATTDLPITRAAERLPPPDEHSWIGQVSWMLEGWRGGRTVRERIEYLTEFVEKPIFPDIANAAWRRLAYAYGVPGNMARTLEIIQRLLAQQPDSAELRFQVARCMNALGRYRELWEHLEKYPLTGAYAERIGLNLDFVRGHVAKASQGIASRAAVQHDSGKHRLAVGNEAVVLWQRTLTRQASISDCEALVADGDRHGFPLTIRSGLASKIVCLGTDRTRVQEVVSEVRTVLSASSGRRGWREWASELIYALRVDDSTAVTRIREEWEAFGPSWSPLYQVVDYVFIHAGYPPTFPPVDMADGSDPAEIAGRWSATVRALFTAAP